jgi:predicted transcriptional regulator
MKKNGEKFAEEFATLKEYLELQADWGLAGVPVPVVAEHLRVTPAAVSAMLKNGRLRGVKIGKKKKTTLVTLASLQAREAELVEEVKKVEAYLEKLAKKKTRAVFYEPVMDEIDLNWRVPADRNHIGVILANVSKRSSKNKGVLLSVLVHKKRPGVTRPSDGFFELLRELKIPYDDADEFVRQETDKVLATYK